MKYLRVNLLKKEEQRYQASASHQFIALAIGAVVFLSIIGFGGVRTIQYRKIKSDLELNQAAWKKLEPRLTRYKEEKKGLILGRNLMSLLKNWQDTQLDFYELLTEIQQATPKEVQFTSLSIRIDPAVNLYEKPEDFSMEQNINLYGLAEGRRATDLLGRFGKAMLSAKGMKVAFDTLELDKIKQCNVSDENELPLWEFYFKGEGGKGGDQ